MFYVLLLLTPLLLVFGLYHLMTWFDVFRINGLAYWKRVGIAAGIAHLLLATGFFIFTYMDYSASGQFGSGALGYGNFLFNHSEFRRFLLLFDVLPMAVLVGTYSVMDRTGLSGGSLVVAIAVTYVFGTLQWFLLGGVAGSLLTRFWDGLKTGDEGEEWFQ